MKIIEDYSKQSEVKSKEIELLNKRIDKKSDKLDGLKKYKSDSEVKITKLRGTLDNVKTFLRLLNSNFIKSMKSQSQSLKDQINNNTKEYKTEIESLKNLLA